MGQLGRPHLKKSKRQSKGKEGQEVVVCQNAGRLLLAGGEQEQEGGGAGEGRRRLFARTSDKKCNFFARDSSARCDHEDKQPPPQKPLPPTQGGHMGNQGQLLLLKNCDHFFQEIIDFKRDIQLILAKPAKKSDETSRESDKNITKK